MKYIVILLYAMCMYLSAHGQTVKGHIVESENTGLSFANVVLYSDSTFLAGTITDEEGRFSFEREYPEANRIRVSMVGFEDYTATLPADGELGSVMMHPASVTLDEITVSADLPATRISGNGMETRVANSILADAGTATDVLSKTPMVTVTDGDFTVFGRGKPLIYINGRIVSSPEELNQLSSHDVKTVEVITNPGPEFPADTKAVIRIKTTPPKGEGLSISVYSYSRFANFATNAENMNMKYRRGGLELFATAYFHGGKRKFQDINTMMTYASQTMTQDINVSTTMSWADWHPKAGFNYQLGQNHSFGAYYEYGHEKTKLDGDILTDIVVDNSPSESIRQHQRETSRTIPIHDANLYYNGEIAGLTIDFNASFLKKGRTKYNRQTESTTGSALNDITTDARYSNRMWAERLSLSYPLWNGSLEIGEEFTDSKSSYLSRYTGADISGGDILIRENNIAGMAGLRQNLGAVQAMVGVRFEHVNYKYFDGNIQNPELTRTYTDWFPSLSLSSRIKNMNLSLSITSRTSRPAYDQLDGTVIYVNRYTYQNGNPSLTPSRIYSAQLMAQWRFIFAQAQYSHEKNAIFTVARPYDDTSVVKLVTFENVARYQNFQFSFGAQPSVGRWSPQATAGMFCNFYSDIFRGTEKNFRRPYFFINWDNAVSLPHDWVIDLDMMARTAGYSTNYYLKAAGYVNIGIRKHFLGKSLTLQLKTNDIFNTNNYRNILYCGDIKIAGEHRQESRNIVFSVNYSLNSSSSKYKGTGAGTDEKGRF